MSIHCIKRVQGNSLFPIRKSEKTCSWIVRNMPSCNAKVYLTFVVLSMHFTIRTGFKARKPQAHSTVWTSYCNIERNAKKSFSGCLDIFLKDTKSLSSKRLAKALILTNKKIHSYPIPLHMTAWNNLKTESTSSLKVEQSRLKVTGKQILGDMEGPYQIVCCCFTFILGPTFTRKA